MFLLFFLDFNAFLCIACCCRFSFKFKRNKKNIYFIALNCVCEEGVVSAMREIVVCRYREELEELLRSSIV